MNRFLLTMAGLVAGLLVVGSGVIAQPAVAAGGNLECSGTPRSPICDLSASGSSSGFSNERWKVNSVAYSNGDDQESVKFFCPRGTSYLYIGVTYTDSSGTVQGESTAWSCE